MSLIRRVVTISVTHVKLLGEQVLNTIQQPVELVQFHKNRKITAPLAIEELLFRWLKLTPREATKLKTV